MSICKEYFGGNWYLFFYRMPWTLALRGIIDAPWYEDEKKEGDSDVIDCENITDEDIQAIQNLANIK